MCKYFPIHYSTKTYSPRIYYYLFIIHASYGKSIEFKILNIYTNQLNSIILIINNIMLKIHYNYAIAD